MSKKRSGSHHPPPVPKPGRSTGVPNQHLYANVVASQAAELMVVKEELRTLKQVSNPPVLPFTLWRQAYDLAGKS